MYRLATILSILCSYASAGVVMVARIDGAINPATAGYAVRAIEEAQQSNAHVLILEIDTPGGLMESMRSITGAMLNASIPVVVHVAPAGARAASAGAFICAASHIAAMSPGTHLGAAHPVGMGGAMDSIMSGKAESDAAAQIRSLATQRGRNASWYENSVRESLSATAKEALDLGVIDLLARDRTELLQLLDGRTVTINDTQRVLSTKDAVVKDFRMSLRFRLLHQIANPNLAYIFLILGFYGLYFELSNPGSIFPGVVGGILLLLGIFAMQMMPVNYVGVLLIAFAMLLFLAEIKITSYGLLTLGGIVALVLGSLMLFDTTEEVYRVSLSVIIPVVAVTVAFFLFAVGMGVRAQRRRPVTGASGLLGARGTVVGTLAPSGKVFVNGEIWFATAQEQIEEGADVVVTGVDGMRLTVAVTPRSLEA
ncbi:nodulation protein NfeD [Candidatus Fermentibacteria bacterium]|nr:nodulation protein NfeD [Candidatus Fermentibacteria bacterium]